jgi:hypothetical protein
MDLSQQGDVTSVAAAALRVPLVDAYRTCEPRVALLFSDPTASGLRSAPQVLVQGTATCPDQVVTAGRRWTRAPVAAPWSEGPGRAGTRTTRPSPTCRPTAAPS